jgi:hypothetical protein
MNELLRAGAREGGYRAEIPSRTSELEALEYLLGRSHRGDVCVVMAHVERQELFDRLASDGFQPVGIDQLRKHLGR